MTDFIQRNVPTVPLLHIRSWHFQTHLIGSSAAAYVSGDLSDPEYGNCNTHSCDTLPLESSRIDVGYMPTTARPGKLGPCGGPLIFSLIPLLSPPGGLS